MSGFDAIIQTGPASQKGEAGHHQMAPYLDFPDVISDFSDMVRCLPLLVLFLLAGPPDANPVFAIDINDADATVTESGRHAGVSGVRTAADRGSEAHFRVARHPAPSPTPPGPCSRRSPVAQTRPGPPHPARPTPPGRGRSVLPPLLSLMLRRRPPFFFTLSRARSIVRWCARSPKRSSTRSGRSRTCGSYLAFDS